MYTGGKRKHSESEDPQHLPPSAAQLPRSHRGHHGYKPEASRPRALSKEFAQEFHESVLQATRQQQENRAGTSTLKKILLSCSKFGLVLRGLMSIMIYTKNYQELGF